ncbi:MULTISPECIES: integrase core domain-containing protein [unclassified Rhodococcus (in: high G+C Gram-positive bacteria)]|uniref:integrase core domain-containing protein n=1 Tax=unclassified Rhodococcus (in: high G+C Gram-positive bacteria) TaxID=192944 RepID=UPI001B34A07C|nr:MULTISPECIES: integrase core domain-containing protein [unclassified Rhodococcus (in: high G+C Gram-positive bacteria)]
MEQPDTRDRALRHAHSQAHTAQHDSRSRTQPIGEFRLNATAPPLRKARHYRIKPYTLKYNGRVERYNRFLTEELLYSREYTSEQQRRNAAEIWNIDYNHH